MISPLLDSGFNRQFAERINLSEGPSDHIADDKVSVYTLRYATPNDISQCEYLASTRWPAKEARRYGAQIGAMFRSSNGPTFFIAAHGSKIVGFAGMRESWAMPDTAELIGVCIDKAHESKGIATTLTTVRLDLAKVLGIKYVTLGTIKPEFFERFGFEAIDHTREWCVMSREL